MLGWENPLAILADAAGTALGRVALFFAACSFGCGVAMLSSSGPLPLGRSPLAAPVYWIGGIPFGIMDGWGIIAYVVLFAILLTLIVRETGETAHLYVIALFVQAAETARMLATRGWLRIWLFAILMAVVVAGVAGLVTLAQRSREARNRRRYRRNMGYCVECGYDVHASVLAGSTTCPECGAEVPRYTVRLIRDRGTPRPLSGPDS